MLGILDGVVEAIDWMEEGVLGILDGVVEAIDWMEEGVPHKLGVI